MNASPMARGSGAVLGVGEQQATSSARRRGGGSTSATASRTGATRSESPAMPNSASACTPRCTSSVPPRSTRGRRTSPTHGLADSELARHRLPHGSFAAIVRNASMAASPSSRPMTERPPSTPLSSGSTHRAAHRNAAVPLPFRAMPASTCRSLPHVPSVAVTVDQGHQYCSRLEQSSAATATWSGSADQGLPSSVLGAGLPKNAFSTVDGQRHSRRPPSGPVRNPCTAPGGMKTNVPGPTPSAGSESV